MKITEAMIHFELYRNLKNYGYDVVPEYKMLLKNEKTKSGKQKSIIVDIAIFRSNKPVLLIEVKKPKKYVSKFTKQYNRYVSTDIQFIYKTDCLIDNVISIMDML